nr:MAG TPA: hypothetical protein [Caudoviricetes sp.]
MLGYTLSETFYPKCNPKCNPIKCYITYVIIYNFYYF